MRFFLGFFITIFTMTAHAQDVATDKPWAHESEVGIATVAGNTESETYTGKQTTSFTIDPYNKIGLSARYLRSEAAGVESARNWDSAFRFERAFSNTLSAFASYGFESDIFAGYVQRNNADIGLKYQIAKSKPTSWFVEAGYRNSDTILVGVAAKQNIDFARLYTEVSQAIGEQTSLKFWAEYLPSLDDMNDYRLNLEPSLVAQLSGVFSLKTGYLVKYQSVLVPPVTKYADRFFTTALVAKF